MKIYHIAISLAFLCLSYISAARSDNLPYCDEDACIKVFHNKAIGKATLVVWSGKDNVLNSLTFELDKTAKLTQHNYNQSGNELTVLEDSPPPACSGDCSNVVTRTYVTATEIITVATTFVYSDGQLIDVQITELSRVPRPDIPTEEK